MTNIKILRDKPTTTVAESGYQLYIDTSLTIDSRTYGTYSTKYDPYDEDLFLKKVPGVSDMKLTRKLDIDTPRFLHIINLTNKESVRGIAKLLCFTYEWKEDSRTRLVNNSKVVVLDYTPKSISIFTKDLEIVDKIKELDPRIMYNRNLTGPKMEKEPGYIVSKSSKFYAGMMNIFEEAGSTTSKKESSDDEPEGNGEKQLVSSSKDGNVILSVWGEEAYISSKIEELDDTKNIGYVILTKKSLSSNGRKIIQIELLDKSDSDDDNVNKN